MNRHMTSMLVMMICLLATPALHSQKVDGHWAGYQVTEPEECPYCHSEEACECAECHFEYRSHFPVRGQGRPGYCDPDTQHAYDCGLCGTWFPEDPVLFRPFLADPRQLTYSLGWRFNDHALPKNTVPISFWDTIPFYRWCSVGPWCGQLQFELDGGLWAIFSPLQYSAPLINADYYVGGAFTYAFCDWSFRLRYFHISSHIGDEYLLDHPDFDRYNPSSETLDFYVSNQFTEEIRWYAGAGFVTNRDKRFKCARYIVEGGTELRMPCLGFTRECGNLCGHPFYGMHFRWNEKMDKHVDSTYVLGYEFTKFSGLRRRVRFFVEYHDGYSLEGQFCKEHTNYLSLKMSYGY